jgi:hypothetical protein
VQWPSSVEQNGESQQTNPNLRSREPNSPDHERTQAASGLLHLNSGGQCAELSQTLSSNATAIFPDPSIAEPSDTTVTAFTPPDAAFSKWVRLLTSDIAPLNRDVLEFGTTVHGLAHGQGSTSQNVYLGSPQERPTYLVNGQEATPINQVSDSSLHIATSSNFLQTHAIQKPPWHGSEPSKLLAHEQVIFENFVKYTSTWV